MQIPADWQIPAQISQRLGDRPGRQRHMFHEGHLLLIVHKVPVGRTPERNAVYFYKNPEGNWLSTSRGAGIPAMNQLQEAYEGAIDQLEARMQAAHDATAYFNILQDIQPIHRASSNMLAALQCARDETGPDKTLIAMRDRAAEIDRAAALVHEEARNAMDYYLAMQAEIQAQNSQRLHVAAHRLNIMAAIFLPLMALASLFGMNLRSGLEERHPAIFWAILVLSLIIGLVITVMVAASGARRT